MRIALYARATPSAPGREDVDQALAELEAYAAQRGWEIVLEAADHTPGLRGRRQGLQRLLEAVRAGTIQAILIRTLAHLAHSLRHLTDLGHLLTTNGIALIALEDDLDTTDPAGAIRWMDWLNTAHRLDRQLRAEAAHLARQSHPDAPWGRPAAVISPQELLSWWEGRGGRQPLPLRQIARKLGVSESTVRKRLRALRAAGRVNDAARAQALTRRPLSRGGRPSTTINDTDLTAAWMHHLQKARGTRPSIAAIACTLRVSRSRVRARLEELGLLEGQTSSTESDRERNR